MTATDLSLGAERLKAVKERVAKLLAFYRALQKVSMPETIEEVNDKEEPNTQQVVPKLSKEILEHWNTKAESIESINQALADFEFGVCEEMTVSSESIIFSEVHKIFAKFEWLAGHIGEITLMLAATLGYGQGLYGGDAYDALILALTSALDGDFKAAGIALKRFGQAGVDAVEFLATSAILGIFATIMESTLEEFERQGFDAVVKPILALKTVTEVAIEDEAFPQGKGRVRRTKLSRVPVAKKPVTTR